METNQINNPKPKKKRVDSLGNDKRRLFLKDGNTTMLFCQGLTSAGCKALINSINTTLIALGKKPKNNWIITK